MTLVNTPPMMTSGSTSLITTIPAADGALADGDSRADDAPCADPDIPAHSHLPGDQGGVYPVVLVVVQGGSDCVVSHEGTILQHDFTVVLKLASSIDENVLPNLDAQAELRIEGRERPKVGFTGFSMILENRSTISSWPWYMQFRSIRSSLMS